MIPIKSIYNSLKLRSKASVSLVLAVAIACLLQACAKSEEHTTHQAQEVDATGKGNGGNGLKVSDKDVEAILKDLKPKLEIVFEGLRLLVQTEKAAPGATDLSQNQEMLKHLQLMFGGDAPAVKDLATQGNIVPQQSPCTDFRGKANAAAAVLGEVGGHICISTEKIRASAFKNIDHAAEIFVLALVTHEFVHHFVETGSHDTDEKAAQEVQEFVEQQLARHAEVTDPNVISTDDVKYIEQFRDWAKEISQSAMVDQKAAVR